MNIRILLPFFVAATLGLSATSSFADTYEKRGRMITVDHRGADRHDQKERRHDRKEDRRDAKRDARREERQIREHRAERRAERRYDRRNDRRHDRVSRSHERRHPGVRYYYNARGPEFTRGHHLPRDLRISQYVVGNPGRHHLSPPPRGHHWVQVGGDYVLVAIASGIIANIIFSR